MARSDGGNGAHRFTAHVTWTGNLGDGTATHAGYSRDYTVLVPGKPALPGSAAPLFRGDAGRHNPEDMFLAAVGACHMLFYLSRCASRGIRVLSYDDEVSGTLTLDRGGGGRFTEVILRPVVTVVEGADEALAMSLHDAAHNLCFIANSCTAVIRHQATLHVVDAPPATHRAQS
jgi:organic hydroperoxide reductase OsmC/OhrA